MPPVGFEPTIAADERPQIYVLDSAATRTGSSIMVYQNEYEQISQNLTNTRMSQKF